MSTINRLFVNQIPGRLFCRAIVARSLLGLFLGLSGSLSLLCSALHTRNGSHAVAIRHSHHLDTLCRATSLRNLVGLHANHRGSLGDNKQLMLRPHGLHCRQLALAVGHLNGEDALAAAVLLRIVGDRSSFAKAVLGDDKEVARTVGNLHAQDTCAVFHSDAAHTAGIAAGGTHLILAENDSLA